MPFPESLRAKKQMLVCYQCLRAGKAAIAKSTEFGGVCAGLAFEGITDVHPAPPIDQFELIAIHGDEGDGGEIWYRARIPGEHHWELLRTPSMINWQDETWLFCCQRPMAYLGGYQSVLKRVQPDDPIAFVEGLFGPEDEVAGWIGEAVDSGNVSLYLYQCKACERYRATYDHT